MSRLKEEQYHKDEIVDAMIKKFGYKNIMEVPNLTRSSSTWVLVKQKRMPRFWIPQ